jgi:putative hydroxymethylpyrimidine transport system substrate-binding protein
VARCALVLLIGVFLLGGFAYGGSKPEQVSVLLDWTPNPDHVGLYDALKTGLFAKAGLDVHINAPSDATTPLKLVGVGRTDLAVSYEQEVFIAVAKKLPVITVAAIVPTPLNSFMSLDPKVHSLADLRGKSIGITGVPADYATLKSAGLDGHVKVVTVGYNLLPALLAHRVDAVLGVYRNVEGIQLAQKGLHPTVIPVDRAGVPSYDELVLVANANRLKSDAAYRSEVQRFVRALAAGTRDARAHPAQAISILAGVTASGHAFLAQATPATLKLLTTTCFDLRQWQRFGAWMAAHKLLAHPVPASSVATAEFCR